MVRQSAWAASPFSLTIHIMNVIEIRDPADVRLDPYRDLRFEDVLKRGQRFIAEGRLVVKRLLQSRHQTESVLAEASRLDELRPLIHPSTPVYLVEPSLIREVAGFNFHRGLLACGFREPFQRIDSLHDIALNAAHARLRWRCGRSTMLRIWAA